MDDFSIDIVVPAYRLDETVIHNIVDLDRPEYFTVFIYIIADNPAEIISKDISRLNEEGKIRLSVNKKNLGAAASRNKGIRAGNSKWILFLDDDIFPDKNLLLAYADAIQKNPDAIGFAGVTNFPLPFNAVTHALKINGTTDSYTQAKRQAALTWSPTANVMLNRNKMDENLFDESLVTAEDIDFLTRNRFLFNEKYIAFTDAIVHHAWWNKGKMQTKRMLNYGSGASQISRKQPIKNFTYHDFTNTSETLLLLVLFLPVFIFYKRVSTLITIMIIAILAEYITAWVKVIVKGKIYSPLVAFHLMWAKNCYEFAFLFTSLKQGYINGFAKRIDMGFDKPHPSSFRLNRWKIIKLLLFISILLLFITI